MVLVLLGQEERGPLSLAAMELGQEHQVLQLQTFASSKLLCISLIPPVLFYIPASCSSIYPSLRVLTALEKNLERLQA